MTVHRSRFTVHGSQFTIRAVTLLALAGAALADDPPGGAAGLLDARLAAACDAAARAAAETRGLPFLRPVGRRVASREEFARHVGEVVDRDFPRERQREIALSLAAWGFLPEGYDLRATYMEMFADEVVGYYDPREGELVLLREAPADVLERVVGHEVVHALQDQHFGLEGLVRPDRNTDDEAWAHAAVVEGEATLLESEGSARRTGERAEPGLGARLRRLLEERARTVGRTIARVPPLLRENLIFPYAEGTAFVEEVRRRFGWPGLTLVFWDPPASTEQVLHPERYMERRDFPTRFRIPDLGPLLPPGSRRAEANVLGEHAVKVLLAPAVGAEAAAAAADGWDGIEFVVWEAPRRPPGAGPGPVLAFASAWDSEGDAAAFAAAYEKARAARPAVPRDPAPAPPRLERRGDLVFGLEGAPADPAEALWEALVRSERVLHPRDPGARDPGARRG
ncbi:MAG: hypothetical protein L0216_02750 [Planctomycetales bacterium]|nr:hypothetical protein [Planctomycetales bacterium]